MSQQIESYAASTGLVMTGGDWLDLHFEAARPEYEAQLRMVGIQPGSTVLDAGCGSGGFLPWLADLVGPSGRLAAVDLAADNVAVVERRLAGWNLPCPVELQAGTVFDLPYADDTFDAVWFANTSQYLVDEELETALAELQRVVRPGGLVAIKETDVTMYRVFPAPAGLMLRYFEARSRIGNVQASGALRTPALPGWLRRRGVANVRLQTTLIERNAPFTPVVRENWRQLLHYLAEESVELDLPPADRVFWTQLRDSAELEDFLSDPECWVVEANVLTVGEVPAHAGPPA